MRKPVVVYFGPDRTDAAVRRRCTQITRTGVRLIAFNFDRKQGDIPPSDDISWDDVSLGSISDGHFAMRILKLFWSVLRVLRQWPTLRSAHIFYCRNLDLALLGAVVRRLIASQSRFVYEVLDVHPLCISNNLLGKWSRLTEKWVLQECDLLVISSEGYLRNYFSPVQAYDGPLFLMENRVPLEANELLAIEGCQHHRPSVPAMGEPWRIGFVGKLRCVKSLNILSELAERLGEKIEIVLRGIPQPHVKPVLDKMVSSQSNVFFEGPYLYPHELERVYRDIHLNWCIDLSDNHNAKWLLPNRLYEGGFFSIPALAVLETETGRIVQERGLGISMQLPLLASLEAFITSLTPARYSCLVNLASRVPKSQFVDTRQHECLFVAIMKQ